MSNHRISLDVAGNGQGVIDQISPLAKDAQTISRLAAYLEGVAAGNIIGKLRMNLNAVQASGTITFASFVADDYVTVNGVTLTGKASPSGAAQFAVGSSDEDCANNLAAKINASTTNKLVGCVGATRRATVQFSAFVANDYVTLNGVKFIGKASPSASIREEFAIGGTDTETAANFAVAVGKSLNDKVRGVTATAASGTVTLNYNGTLTVAGSAHTTDASKTVVVTCLIPGQIGNLCTLAISAHGTVSGAALTGGTEGTQYLFDTYYKAV